MPSQTITMRPVQQKSFLGDFLGATIVPALTLAGTAIGGPIGGVLGTGIGAGIRAPLSKLKTGGQIMPQNKTTKPKRMKKGSKEAKAYMASLRAMRRK